MTTEPDIDPHLRHAAAVEPRQKWGPSARRLPQLAADASSWGVVWVLLIEIAVFSMLEPDSFFTITNGQAILGSQAVLLMIAIGLTVPLAANEFDLSVASMVAFSQVVVGWLSVTHGWPLAFAAGATLITCAMLGLVNALLVVRVGVSAFITTLAMGTVLVGIALRISDNETITNIPDALITAASTKLLGIELTFWYGLIGTVMLWYVLGHTPLGRWLYFTGANPEAARLNGVPVGLVRGGALVTSATMAGLAGVLYAGIYGTADPNSGADLLLPAFAAVFLGATSIRPGKFNAWGTFFSVYVVITGIVGLSLVTHAVGWISFVFNGGILLVAVSWQHLTGGSSTRREERRGP